VIISTLASGRAAQAIRASNAFPVLVDVEPETFQVDPEKVKDFLDRDCRVDAGKLFNRATGRRVRAMMPTHLLGHPVDLDPLLELANRHELAVVEDAGDSLGGRYRDRPVGQTEWIACFRFDGSGIVTSGNGGMMVTSNHAWATHARDLLEQCEDDRLTNLHAAVGVAQMEQLETHVELKRRIAARYVHGLSSLAGITLMSEAPWAFSTFAKYTLRIDATRYGMDSTTMHQHLQARRIQSRLLDRPLHLSPSHGGYCASRCETAERLYRDALCLPCSVGMTPFCQDRVMVTLREAASNMRAAA
jgi:perosamine synthetase